MREIIKSIKSDIKHYSQDKSTLEKFMVIYYYQGLQGLILYRIINFYFINSEKLLYKFVYKLLFIFLYVPFKNLTTIELHPECKIGKCLYLPHGHSIVISKKAKIGDYVTLHHNCTVGINYKTNFAPIIENNVFIGANSTIIGGVSIGEKSIILSNSSVVKSFDRESIVGGVPAVKVIR